MRRRVEPQRLEPAPPVWGPPGLDSRPVEQAVVRVTMKAKQVPSDLEGIKHVRDWCGWPELDEGGVSKWVTGRGRVTAAPGDWLVFCPLRSDFVRVPASKAELLELNWEEHDHE